MHAVIRAEWAGEFQPRRNRLQCGQKVRMDDLGNRSQGVAWLARITRLQQSEFSESVPCAIWLIAATSVRRASAPINVPEKTIRSSSHPADSADSAIFSMPLIGSSSGTQVSR